MMKTALANFKPLTTLYRNEETAVISCSALKPEYRDMLRNNNPDLIIVYLQGDFDSIWAIKT